jgi:pyroglutamyl-peptidase
MSGFEPFGGYETNPSWEALLPLDGQVISGLEVHVVELPVEWGTAWDVLHDAIRTLHPRVVIGTGMATSLSMRYEVDAVNEQWGEDNAGVTEEGTPVVPGGPEGLAPTIPVEVIATALEHLEIPVTISDDAGTYLCNHVMYHLLHHSQLEAVRPVAAGFVHVPPAPYDGTMTVQDITDAHIIAIDVIATWLQEGTPESKPVPMSHTPPGYFLPGYE